MFLLITECIDSFCGVGANCGYGPYNQGGVKLAVFGVLIDWCPGGSGGRISVYAATIYSFTGTYQARGGSGPSVAANGAAGTIFISQGPYKNCSLLVDNGGLVSTPQYTALIMPFNYWYDIDVLTIQGNAAVALNLRLNPSMFRIAQLLV